MSEVEAVVNLLKARVDLRLRDGSLLLRSGFSDPGAVALGETGTRLPR